MSHSFCIESNTAWNESNSKLYESALVSPLPLIWRGVTGRQPTQTLQRLSTAFRMKSNCCGKMFKLS